MSIASPICKKPDPQRALAAFKFGVSSQYVCMGTLPEAMASLHGDLSVDVHLILLQQVQAIAHASFLAAGIPVKSESGDPSRFWEKANLEGEASYHCEILSLYADHAIPRHSELQPLYQFGRSFGRLRKLVAESTAATDPEISSIIVCRLCGVKPASSDDSTCELIRDILDAASRLQECVNSYQQVRSIWNAAVDKFERTAGKSRKKPQKKIKDILDEFHEFFSQQVQSFLFERLHDDKDEQDAWIHRQLTLGATAKEIAATIRELIKDPKFKHWRILQPGGINSAGEDYRIKHSLPALKRPLGRPPKRRD